MAKYTPNLNLYEKDPVADAGDTFNIKTMMNDNWDKIDTAVGETNNNLTKLDTKFTEQLAEIATNPKSYGVAFDGITDDTEAIQNFFNEVPENATVKFPPNSELLLTYPVFCYKSLKIDWNNCLTKYAGTTDLGVDNGVERLYGAVNFIGSNVGEKIPVTAIETDVFDTLGTADSDDVLTTREMSKITLSDVSTLAVGDFVGIDINTISTWSTNYEDNPAKLRAVAKIIRIDVINNTIYVDVKPDFVFGNVTSDSFIVKKSLLDSVIIENFNYKDITTDAIPSAPTDAQRNSWVGGLYLENLYKPQIIDSTAEGHKFPSILGRFSYAPQIINVEANNPKATSPGCGYVVQMVGCTHGYFENVSGNMNRHLIDFTGGGHHVVARSKQPNTSLVAEFDCHGEGEFDITFRDCTGKWLFGNGINSFPTMTTGITLDNCKGTLQSNWCKKLTILNSEMNLFEIRATQRVVDFYANNSKLYGAETISIFRAYSRGNIYNDSRFVIDNSELIFKDKVVATSTLGLELRGYVDVHISNSKVINKRAKDLELVLRRCQNIHVDSATLQDFRLSLYNNIEADTPLQLSNKATMDSGCLWLVNTKHKKTTNNPNSSSFGFLSLVNMSDLTNFTININGCDYKAEDYGRWLVVTDTTNTSNVIHVNFVENTVGANVTETIGGGGNVLVRSGENNLSEYDVEGNLQPLKVVRSMGSVTLGIFSHTKTVEFRSLSSNVTIYQIKGGIEGQEIIIYNASTYNITLEYNSDKIWLQGTANKTISQYGFIILRFVNGRWIEISSYSI